MSKHYVLLLPFLWVSSVAFAQSVEMTTLKDPQCGCCAKWIEHLPNNYSVNVQHPKNLNLEKDKLGVPADLRSCHTSVVNGLVFEGHIPSGLISSYLDEPKSKQSLGLAVPAMPLGSPGMEVADRFHSYKVYEIFQNGETKVYAEINSIEEQRLLTEVSVHERHHE